MKIRKITLFGSGQLGIPLGFKIAFHGFDITISDISDAQLEKAKAKFREIGDNYATAHQAKPEEINAALARMAYTTNMKAAAGNADLIIESISENKKTKKDFYLELGTTAPKNAIFATTSSILSVNQLSKWTGREVRFLNLRFAEKPGSSVHIIPSSKTKPEVIDTVANFLYEMDLEISIGHKKDSV